MNQNGTRAALVVIMLTALMTAGCGGSDTLSAKEFRSKANKLCAAANKDTDGYGAKITQTSSDADVTAAIDKTVKRNEQLADDIDALKPPKAMADDVDSMLTSVRAGIKELDKITSVKDLTTFDPSTLSDANAKAKKLGLDTCAG